MKRWLLLMTKENLAKCESGAKTQTRRDNPRYQYIRKGDEIYFRSNYLATYKTASGPYDVVDNLRWENLQDISANDCEEEGIDSTPHICGCEICSRSNVFCPATASSIIMAFAELWDSIYGKKPSKAWEDNPRIIRIAFEKRAQL